MNKEKNHLIKLKMIFDSVINELMNSIPMKFLLNLHFGKNVQSMLKLGRAQGVAMLAGVLKKLR